MKLPEIYKNKINEVLHNSQEIFYSFHNHPNLNILPDYFIIETINKTYNVKIIGKTKHYLISNDGDLIKLSECLSIRKR